MCNGTFQIYVDMQRSGEDCELHVFKTCCSLLTTHKIHRFQTALVNPNKKQMTQEPAYIWRSSNLFTVFERFYFPNGPFLIVVSVP